MMTSMTNSMIHLFHVGDDNRGFRGAGPVLDQGGMQRQAFDTGIGRVGSQGSLPDQGGGGIDRGIFRNGGLAPTLDQGQRVT
jgi:hypothetical protein